jgi:hypothetical protein
LEKIDTFTNNRYEKFQAPKDINERINNFFKKFISDIESQNSDIGRWFVKSMRKDLTDTQVGNLIREHFKETMKSIIDTAYTYSVLCFTSYLTIQHSTISRYPSNKLGNKSPSKIYKSNLPIVKYQPVFLTHLTKAISTIEKYY